jgi:hypothetical protein
MLTNDTTTRLHHLQKTRLRDVREYLDEAPAILRGIVAFVYKADAQTSSYSVRPTATSDL